MRTPRGSTTRSSSDEDLRGAMLRGMKWLRLAVVLGLALLSVSCRSAGRRGVFLDLTVFEQNSATPVHDVLVWPVAQRNTDLGPELLKLMTERLHKGVAGRQYSVLSRTLVEAQAKRLGTAEDAAIRATKDSQGRCGARVPHYGMGRARSRELGTLDRTRRPQADRARTAKCCGRVACVATATSCAESARRGVSRIGANTLLSV